MVETAAAWKTRALLPTAAFALALGACGAGDTSATDDRRAPSAPLRPAETTLSGCTTEIFEDARRVSDLSDADVLDVCRATNEASLRCVPAEMSARHACRDYGLSTADAVTTDAEARSVCENAVRACDADAGAVAPLPEVDLLGCARFAEQRASCTATVGQVRSCYAVLATLRREDVEGFRCELVTADGEGGVVRERPEPTFERRLYEACKWREGCSTY